jgi:acetyltransferase-like isoleucine patch superfamily enzyme
VKFSQGFRAHDQAASAENTSAFRTLRRDVFLACANIVLALPSHAVRIAFFRHGLKNDVGSGTVIERRCRVTSRGGVRIGRNSIVNRGTLLDGRGGLTIGDNVNISGDVLLLTAQHDVDSPDFAAVAAPVAIGDRTWISSRSIVLPGSTLADGCVVAAGALVRGDVAPFTVIGGVPARVLRQRSSDAQQSLPPYRRWLH